jgi:CRP-like cAMP-binding protein
MIGRAQQPHLGAGAGYPAANQALVRKLLNYGVLEQEDVVLLLALPTTVRTFGPRCDIVEDGQPPRGTNLVLSGLACRLKVLPDGRKQILGFLIAGDFCDLHVMLLDRLDHAISTVTATVVALLPEAELRAVMDANPRVARVFWVASLVQEAIAREWILSLGRRSAYERTAHLFCEFYERLRAVGLADHGRCDLPLTQADLADALGLSQVHINRTLQEMREAGLIELRGRRLHIPDLPALHRAALFDPGFLHLPSGRR